MRVAHNLSKVKPVIVRNLPPAFATLMQCYDVIEASTGFVCEQVRLL
jgi:hypothetical protein